MEVETERRERGRGAHRGAETDVVDLGRGGAARDVHAGEVMGPSDAGRGEATRDACRMKCKITSDARDDVAAKTR